MHKRRLFLPTTRLTPNIDRTYSVSLSTRLAEETSCSGSSSGNCYRLPKNQSALSIPHVKREHNKKSCPAAMASSGTMRGTPKGRGTVPAFTNSPAASNIPRPALESHPSGSASEAGGSTMSASRQKQSKRDEVCLTQLLSLALCTTDDIFTGYSEENRDGSQQEEAYHWPSTTNTKSTSRNCPRPSPQSSPPDQTKYYCC